MFLVPFINQRSRWKKLGPLLGMRTVTCPWYWRPFSPKRAAN